MDEQNDSRTSFTADDQTLIIIIYEISIAYFPTTYLPKEHYFNLILRLSSESKIWFDGAETREQLLCLVIVDRSMNNNIVVGLINQ